MGAEEEIVNIDEELWNADWIKVLMPEDSKAKEEFEKAKAEGRV